jgi:DNA-3-methyladenine glycosylase II
MSSVPRSGNVGRAITHESQVKTPYRLDLTVSALRRTATNLVDVSTTAVRYLRALGGFDKPVVVSVKQPHPDLLAVSIGGSAGDAKPVLASVRRMLGADCDLSAFHQNARTVPWLAPLARRMRDLKPPRYPDLFEACANAVLFQQVSLHAASAIMRRLIVALGRRSGRLDDERDEIPQYVLP